MTYTIMTKEEYPIFNIEYYKTKNNDINKWYSEINVNTYIQGIATYVYSKKNDNNFNLDEFINDGKEIQDLKRWLWIIEGNYEVEKHHTTRQQYIEKLLNNFVKKYKLLLDID